MKNKLTKRFIHNAKQSNVCICIAMKPFAQAVALITVFTVATRAVGFLFRIFLSRVLGAEMLGVYQIAMSFFMVFLTVIASGLPLAISKEVAKARERGGEHNKEIGAIAIAGLVISLIVSTALCGIVFVFREFVDTIFTDRRCLNILLILLPSIIACSVYTALRAVWWGEKKFFLLGATELFEQVVRVLFFVILLGFGFAGLDSAGLAGLSFTIACVASAAAVIYIYLKGRKGTIAGTREQSRRFYRPLIRSALPITGVRVIGSIALPIISVIIPLRLVASGWTNIQAISQYGIVVGMTLPLLTIPGTIISALATALVPELSGAHERHDHKNVSAQISNALKFTLFVTFIILPTFMALGEQIGLFLYDNTLSGTYLASTAWVMIPLSLNQITNAILNSLGAEIKALKHYFYGSIALFAIVWFFPSLIGVNALIVGMGICMLITSCLNLLMIAKLTNAKTQVLRLTLAFIGISIPATLLGQYMFGIIQHIWPLIISLPLAGAATVAVVLLFCKMFNLVDLGIILRKNRKL